MIRIALLAAVAATLATPLYAKGWQRHTIDDASRGADGVRLGDINGDGRPDITTGWEEGGRVRVYLHPGTAKVKEHWPAVTIGRVKSPEDAVFFDFDGDGVLDVVSSCEGNTRTAFVHFAAHDRAKLLDESAWRTEAIAATKGQQQWMYAACRLKLTDGTERTWSSDRRTRTAAWAGLRRRPIGATWRHGNIIACATQVGSCLWRQRISMAMGMWMFWHRTGRGSIAAFFVELKVTTLDRTCR